MKSFKLLALLAVLGLGACSVAEGKFLDQVKGKSVHVSDNANSDQQGQFSTDGRVWLGYRFDSASDDNTAIYINTEGENSIFKINGNKLTLGSHPNTFYLFD